MRTRFVPWVIALLLLALITRNLLAAEVQADTIFLPVILKNFGHSGGNVTSVTGELYTFLGAPIPGTTFYLTQTLRWAVGDPKEEDIVSITDRQGQFVLTAIPPGNYYILVWAPYRWVYVPVARNDLFPRLFIFEANKNHALGRIEMVWP